MRFAGVVALEVITLVQMLLGTVQQDSGYDRPDTYDRALDEPAVAPERGLGYLPNEPYYRQPARRGAARIVGAILLIVGLLWLFAQFGPGLSLPFGMGSGSLLDTSYTARQLVIDIDSGDVEVRTWNEPTIHVEATYRGGSAGDYALLVEPRGDTLAIGGGAKPFVPLFGPRNVQYRITLPATTDTRIKTTNGDIDVAGLDGQTNLESTNGNIEATKLAHGLTVATVNGKIELNAVGGALQANSTNGTITLDDGTVENVHAETLNGNIELSGVAGTLDVKSTNGDIAIEDGRNATVSLSSINSDVRYEGSIASGAAHVIDSVSGDVDLRLDENAGFDLEADTASGDISTDYALANQQQDRRSLRGRANGGGASLKVSTTSGDISVETR